MSDTQADVVAFLSSPATHAGSPVRRIDTHASIVFLAGTDAFKLKRAVRYPYLDFSTLEKRRAAADAEMAANAAAAPQIYLGVVPVTRRPDGTPQLGGRGPVVEWLVHMRRFDEGSTFDRLAARGELTADLIEGTADAVAALHARAPVRREPGASASLAEIAAENAELLSAAPAGALPADNVAALAARTRNAIIALGTLLDERRAQGFVRRGHGDLHLRNVCLVDGRPTLFDALEFDERLATVDVLYDIAFLLMDLWQRGSPALANRLLNRYLEHTRDLDGLAALPVFLSTRAAIRAHVALAAGRQAGGVEAAAREARAYLDEALAMLDDVPAQLVAIGGWSGTGKTSQARLLAPTLGRPPGAIVLRSDIARKRMLGVPSLQRLEADGYTPQVTERVYAELGADAARCVRSGQAAIVDAVCARPHEREALSAEASGAGVAFHGVWLVARSETRVLRVAGRHGDASDADAGVVRRQEALDVGALDWSQVDAGGAPDTVAAAVRAVVAAGPKH